MDDILTKKEAIQFLKLDDKIFDNYFKNAGEFPCIKRAGRGRFMFDKLALQKWKDNLVWRTVELTKEDYALCLDFALAIHFKEYVLSDFGSGRQREFGQKITNWVKGQLGELAVQKFFKKEDTNRRRNDGRRRYRAIYGFFTEPLILATFYSKNFLLLSAL